MSETGDHGGQDDGDGHGGQGTGHDHDDSRTTAPMSGFTTREVGIGAVIALVGLAVVFGVPLALTL